MRLEATWLLLCMVSYSAQFWSCPTFQGRYGAEDECQWGTVAWQASAALRCCHSQAVVRGAHSQHVYMCLWERATLNAFGQACTPVAHVIPRHCDTVTE